MKSRKPGHVYLLAAFLCAGTVVTAHGQACRDRPMIVRPRIIKPIVQRPVFIRPYVEKAVIEQPEFLRPMRERPMIMPTKIERPLFDWCGDLVVPLDPEATAPRVGRSLNELLTTGRYTPGSSLKKSYLAAVRTAPAGNDGAAPGSGSGDAAGASCCGDTPAPTKTAAVAVSKPALLQYRDQPPRRFPVAMARRDAASATTAPEAVKAFAAAPVAAVGAISAATMVVPRGSR